jgi:uncharacterized protein (TIGR00369 family)
MQRTRTFDWEDPVANAELGRGLSGFEFMRAIRDGTIPPPPIARLMDFDLAEVEEGRAVFTVEPAEFHYNPIGMVHGGLAATLIDSATGCAVHTTLPAGVAYTTLEFKTNFVRPISHDTGRIRCAGEVLHRGGTIATAEARLTSDETGKLLAHGVATCAILGRRS